MTSFEELSLDAELVEILASEGIEVPTPLQVDALPVLLRGNNAILVAGPGAGALVAYGAALLQRLEPGPRGPALIVVVPLREIGDGLAESLARLAQSTGHSVAVLGRPWALPEHADVLFGTPKDLLDALKGGRLSVEGVGGIVVEGSGILDARGDLDQVASLLGSMPKEAQRIAVSLPLTEGVDLLAREHLPRAVRIPPVPADAASQAVRRGTITYRIVGEDKEHALAQTVDELLSDEVRHVLVFSRSEDRAADFGDFLTLHGYTSGPVGEGSVPVWLGLDALEARKALDELPDPRTVATVSVDVPADEDTLDRRHGLVGPSMIFALPRELHHLRFIAGKAGYTVQPAEESRKTVDEGIQELRKKLSDAARGSNLAPYASVVTPLLEAFSGYELAAAALALLDKAEQENRSSSRAATGSGSETARTKLFVSLGTRDGIQARDLLGILASESDVAGSHFGKMDLRESFSLVEIDPDHAEAVIRAVNGRTIRGRAIRVDRDRGGPLRQRPPPRRR
jgi:ATP-dependent RNA helicase DeaD